MVNGQVEYRGDGMLRELEWRWVWNKTLLRANVLLGELWADSNESGLSLMKAHKLGRKGAD